MCVVDCIGVIGVYVVLCDVDDFVFVVCLFDWYCVCLCGNGVEIECDCVDVLCMCICIECECICVVCVCVGVDCNCVGVGCVGLYVGGVYFDVMYVECVWG